MRFDLKRSLFLSVAALGFVAAAGMANSQTASAKTYARVTSNSKMAMLPQDRNVTFTGNNALYTKAGTLRGARVVASKATLSSFSNVSSSTHNVRAYRIATTNRGSIYYKVVTYDGSYRGWIYGGKTDSDFNGGVQQYRTFTNQAFSTLTTAQQNGTYKITTPGTANDGTQVTYKSPAYTNYKVGRAITDSSPYANTQFRIDAVGYRTKEGSSDQWVHIYDPANPNSQATGWIKMSGLTQTNATTPIADNQIQFNIMDPNNSNNTLVSFNWTKAGATRNSYLGNYNTTTHNWSLDSNDQASLQTAINNALSGYNSTHGTNYSYNISNLTQAQLNNLAVAQFGGSVKLYLNSNIADNALRVYFKTPNGTVLSNYYDWTKSGANRGNLVGYQSGSSWYLNGTDSSDLQARLTSALAGTGYALSYGNVLTSDQQSALAQGRFGGTVTISVVPSTNQVTSDIIPQSKFGNGDPVVMTQFRSSESGNTNNRDEAKIDLGITGSLSGGITQKMSAFDLGKLDATGLQNLYTNLQNSKYKSDLTDLNNLYAQSAQKQYLANSSSFDWTYGPKQANTAFTATDITNYLPSDVKNLTSPFYPVLSYDTSSTPTVKITWKQYTYANPQGVNNGTIGNPAYVTYTATN